MAFLKFTESKGFQDRFNFIRDLLVIAGVFFTGISLFYAGRALRDSQKVNSAQFVTNMSRELNGDRYTEITTAIEGDDDAHPGTFPILKSSGGKFSVVDLEDYIGNYDQIADLWQDGLVDERMAYDEFSYDVEKAWCNQDIQKQILIERHIDNHLAGYKAFYSGFEAMAKRFLQIDGDTCADIDKK